MPKPPFRRLASLLVAVALVAMSSGAHAAAIFNFSFSNVNGTVAGTVTGTVTLPDGDGTFAASAVSITGAPAALGFTFPVDALAAGSLVNSFTVTGGSIVVASVDFFGLVDGFTALALNAVGVYGFGFTFLTALNGGPGVLDLASSTLSFTSATAVPEPVSAALFAVALAGLAVGSIRTRPDRR